MAISVRDFWNRLVQSGIADATRCNKLAAAIKKAQGGKMPEDAAVIARLLLQNGVITSYQAKALVADRPATLRLGPWIIRDTQAPPPLSRWLRVSHVESGQRGVLFRAPESMLTGGRESWLRAHVAAEAPSLQRLLVQRAETHTLVASPLPSGRSLERWQREHSPAPRRTVLEIAIAVARALESMHDQNLVHGAVRADRVWIAKEPTALLLRDPSRPPLPPHQQDEHGWMDDVEPAYLYAAPEFSEASSECTVRTDLYSLGCLLFRLSFGRFPYRGETLEQIFAAQQNGPPAELSDAVAKGAAGDPLARVIAFLMATHPDSRLATSAQAVRALEAVQESLPAVAATSATAEDSVSTATAQPQPTQTKAEPTQEATQSAPPDAKPAEVSPARVTPPPEVDVSPAIAPEMATSVVKESGEVSLPRAASSTSSESVPEETATASNASRRPRRKKKSNKAPMILGGMCVAILLLMIFLIAGRPDGETTAERRRTPIPEVVPPVSTGSNAKADRAANTTSSSVTEPPVNELGYELINDDRLLYAPPHAADSESVSLRLLPPGPAMLVSLRLESLLADPAGSEIVSLFADELQPMIAWLESQTGVDADSIERCTLALHPGELGWPEVSVAVELTEPLDREALIERWDVAEARTPSGETIFAGDEPDSPAYFLPESGSEPVSRFATGSIDRMSEVAETSGGAIPLPRMLQSLWDGSSVQSDLVCLMTPNFLFADGRMMLQHATPELVSRLKRFLIPDVAGALISFSIDNERVYAETRLVPSGGITEAALLQSLQSAAEDWPAWAEEFVVATSPAPSWKLLAIRLPAMMRFVSEQMRFGISERTAVANVYLPRSAVPQLTLATVLAFNTPPSAGTVATVSQQPPLTAEQILDRPMSVSFEQESLEFALEAILNAASEELPPGSEMPPARIVGGDLQLMGITQNQQVRDFDKSNVPLRSVLTDLVRAANPDKTATGPADPRQALVWVLTEDPENPGESVILITTRQAAEGKYSLPQEFQSDSRGESN